MLRYTFDSLLLNGFFSYCSKKDIKALFEFKQFLPFRNNISISLGIAVKQLLQSNMSIAEFREKNPNFVNIEYDLKAGYTLWQNAYFLLRYQESKGEFNADLLEMFKKANELLVTRFKELKLVESV